MPISAKEAYENLNKYILRDGMELILDFEKSQGNYLYDALHDKSYLDFFSFFASLPIGFNHPKMKNPEFLAKLARVSQIKPSNSDIYTVEISEFVAAFARIAGDADFTRYFFVSGGALAVENALKAAFDWKIRKNLAAGKGEKGQQVIHFKQAFHGRSGYTLSLTNTVPDKVMYFPKFDWPRISNPAMRFASGEADIAELEAKAIQEIEAAIAANPDDIAALIIEPIQSEGGDNHFRYEFLKALRKICDEHEIIYIFDEVQTGFGLTGKMWAYDHFPEAKPDIVCFGKKAQVCGIMATERLNEVDSVFKVSSRINSTFGGNLVDMVRCQRYLEIIEEDNLCQQAAEIGEYMLAQLQGIAQQYESIRNVRGRGLMLAFDCPSAEFRGQLLEQLFKKQMIALPCGPQSVRFRPGLVMNKTDADRGFDILSETLKTMAPVQV